MHERPPVKSVVCGMKPLNRGSREPIEGALQSLSPPLRGPFEPSRRPHSVVSLHQFVGAGI